MTMIALPDTFPSFPEFRLGEVWLVGAGPGDPRLLTLMALHALRAADDIVHDALVDPAVLDLARAGAVRHAAGKRGGQPSTRQPDINDTLIGLARAGRRVLRLKGGDPFVFGRGAEEAASLAAAGVPFRIVPGLTAGLAGPALAGIPATTRATNHAVILATGHHAADAPSVAQWQALARTAQPIILYMAMGNLDAIAAALQQGGLAPDLPVSVIEAATSARQQVLDTTLAEVADAVETAGVRSPAVVVIGAIAGLRKDLAPFLLGET